MKTIFSDEQKEFKRNTWIKRLSVDKQNDFRFPKTPSILSVSWID